MKYSPRHFLQLFIVTAVLGFATMWKYHSQQPVPVRVSLVAQPETKASTANANSQQHQQTSHKSDAFITQKQCHMRGAWSDMCHYRNVCFSSLGSLVIVSEELPARRNKVEPLGLKMSTKLPMRDPKEDRMFPVHYHGEEYTVITPAELATRQVTWTRSSSQPGNATYVLSLTDSLSNIWYYSSRVLPLFTADRIREEVGLPMIGEVIFPMSRKKINADWHLNLLKHALPSEDIPVYYSEDAPYFGLSRKADDDTSLICTKQAVLLGANVYGFTDMVEAHAFRAKVYTALGIDLPPIQHPDGAQGLPRNVTLLDRPRSEPRHITKVDDTLNLIRKYGVEPNHVVVKFENTFEEQVRLMASTGVFISVHGAGLMNEIFMRPGSVVIEIFPNHMKHILYERVAGYAGLYHFKVFANEHPADLREKHPDYDQHKCEGVRSLDLPGRPDCWRVVKNVVVVVPLRDLEVAFSSALDFLDRTPLLPVAAPSNTKI